MSLYPEDHIPEITKVLIYCLVLPPRRRTQKRFSSHGAQRFDPGAVTLIAACIPVTTENPDALMLINDRRGFPLGGRVAGSHVLPCPGLKAAES